MTWTTMSADEPLVALRGSAGRFYCVFRAVVLPPAAVHTNHGTHPAAVSSWRNVLPSNQIPKVRGRSIKAEHGLDALLYIHHTILLHLWAFSVARTMSGLSRSKLATPSVSLPSKAPKPWVDPHTMPDYGDISEVAGNAPDVVKRLTNNTFASYGVGDEGSFAYTVGRAVKFVEVKVDRKEGRGGRLEATTVCEIVVCKGASCLVSFVLCCSRPPARPPTDALPRHAERRGHDARGVHSLPHRQVRASLACAIAASDLYIFAFDDSCASTPLLVLGLMENVNGVGVTQGLNVTYHAPAPL